MNFRALGLWSYTITSTLVSILVCGWLFGFGFAGALLVVFLQLAHEMGHYLMAKRMKVDVKPPLIIPLLCAEIDFKCKPPFLEKVVWILLAGPLLGSVVAFSLLPIYYWTGDKFWIWGALIGFVINLIELIPLFSSDGCQVLGVLWSSLGDHSLSVQKTALVGSVYVLLAVALFVSIVCVTMVPTFH